VNPTVEEIAIARTSTALENRDMIEPVSIFKRNFARKNNFIFGERGRRDVKRK
jgi:hypothetical protein